MSSSSWFSFAVVLGVGLFAAPLGGCSGRNSPSELFNTPPTNAATPVCAPDEPCPDPSGTTPVGRADGGGGAGQTPWDAGAGPPCNRDAECASGLCNLRLDQCTTAGPDGIPCSRDVECTGGLCNLRLDQCAPRGPDGTACNRDSECLGGLCNLRLDQCAPLGGSGTPCNRDSECAGGLCNLRLDQCSVKLGVGSPCSRDKECTTNLCNTATDRCQ